MTILETAQSQDPVRYVHHATGTVMVKIAAGDVYVTEVDEQITTVLGSCVAVCLRSAATGRGGANHFMLPGDSAAQPENTRYGIAAIAQLVQRLLEDGSSIGNLEAKIFGGASVIPASTDIGGMNIRCAYEQLARHKVPVIAADVGLRLPRKIIFDPKTGKVQLQRLRMAYRDLVLQRERESLDRLLSNEHKETPG